MIEKKGTQQKRCTHQTYHQTPRGTSHQVLPDQLFMMHSSDSPEDGNITYVDACTAETTIGK